MYFRIASDRYVCLLSPQGLRFRSKASLNAFLIENGQEKLDINLFNFTASKGDEVTASSQVKKRGRKKKHGNKRQDYELSDLPSDKSTRVSHSLADTVDNKIKGCVDPNNHNVEIAPENPHDPEASSTIMDDVALQKSPHRVGLLKEKLLRQVPKGQIVLSPNRDEQVSVPALNVDAPTESENEDDRGGKKREIQCRSGKEPDSKLAGGANSVEAEVVSSEITGGSCTQMTDSQNSKYD